MRSAEIFIVEDSPATANLYKTYLKDLGYSSHIFHEGLEAINALNESPPEIHLLDIELPDINGLSILEEVKNKSIPVLTDVEYFSWVVAQLLSCLYVKQKVSQENVLIH